MKPKIDLQRGDTLLPQSFSMYKSENMRSKVLQRGRGRKEKDKAEGVRRVREGKMSKVITNPY